MLADQDSVDGEPNPKLELESERAGDAPSASLGGGGEACEGLEALLLMNAAAGTGELSVMKGDEPLSASSAMNSDIPASASSCSKSISASSTSGEAEANVGEEWR